MKKQKYLIDKGNKSLFIRKAVPPLLIDIIRVPHQRHLMKSFLNHSLTKLFRQPQPLNIRPPPNPVQQELAILVRKPEII